MIAGMIKIKVVGNKTIYVMSAVSSFSPKLLPVKVLPCTARSANSAVKFDSIFVIKI